MTDIIACREGIRSLWRDNTLEENCSHAGLILARYLEEHDSDKTKVRRLLDVAGNSVRRAGSLYGQAFQRWEKTVRDCPEYPCHVDVFSIEGRMVIGLGGASVLETGLTLHHTYGTPVIPGSALKGLAAHYCDQMWGPTNSEFRQNLGETDDNGKQRKGQYYEAIFGSQDDAGHITFHDAWMTPESLQKALQLDVLTPHHQQYYGEPKESNEHPPTDFDDPVPVSFLSITGDFLVALTCDVPGDKGQKWVDLTFELLGNALREWGIGGKTSAGYGRMKLKSAASPMEAPRPKRPRYVAGDQVQVVRVEDTKKGKKCFEADDGFRGVVAYGEEPAIEIGEKISLWVQAAMKDAYNFRSTDPGPGKGSGTKKAGKDHKKGRR